MSVCTPKPIVERVCAVLGDIDLDPCSHPDSIVGAREKYQHPAQDGLKLMWWGRAYVNAPWGYDYHTVGETIAPWLARCALMRRMHFCDEIIAYAPTAPHTHYWGKHVFPAAAAICFAHEPAPLESKYGTLGPVAVSFIYYGRNADRFTEVFKPVGGVVLVPH